MNRQLKAIALYSLYFGPILCVAFLLIRSLSASTTTLAAALPESFTCATVTQQLEAELWLLYDGEVRQLGGGHVAHEALPGPWRRWESTRVLAAKQCPEQNKKIDALLDMRRALANNLFLLQHEIGDALFVLHQQ